MFLLLPFLVAKKAADVVTAVNDPTPANIISAAVPIGAVNPVKAVESVKRAVENPSLANIASAATSATPPVIPHPLQIAADAKEVITHSNGTPVEKLAQLVLQNSIITAPAREAANAGVKTFLTKLQCQAKNKWKSLPAALVDAIKAEYKTDLSQVRYAENITTIGDNAITFCHEIFFPRSISPLTNQSDLHWLLHELAHVEQYQRVGGFDNFIKSYFADASIKAVTSGTFNVHDKLSYETEAEERADRLITMTWKAISTLSPSSHQLHIG